MNLIISPANDRELHDQSVDIMTFNGSKKGRFNNQLQEVSMSITIINPKFRSDDNNKK